MTGILLSIHGAISDCNIGIKMIRYIYMLCTLCDFMQKAGRSEVRI